jgi:bacterial/archaeal transporter family-2 protein
MSPTAAAGLAIFAGVLIAIQAALLGVFERHIHPLTGAFWLHVAGTLFAFVLVLAVRPSFELDGLREFPWGVLAGVAGVGIVSAIAVAVAGLGLGTALVIVVATQLVIGFAMDAFGVTGVVVPVTVPRLAGLALIVAGVVLVYGRTPGT